MGTWRVYRIHEVDSELLRKLYHAEQQDLFLFHWQMASRWLADRKQSVRDVCEMEEGERFPGGGWITGRCWCW
jgi:hypothetical protein